MARFHQAALLFNLCLGLEASLEASSDLDAVCLNRAAWIWLQKYRPEVTQVAVNAVKGAVTNEGQRTPSDAATNLIIGLQRDSIDDSKSVSGDTEEKSTPSESATQPKKRRLDVLDRPSIGHLSQNSDFQSDPKDEERVLGHNAIEQVDQSKLGLLQSKTLDLDRSSLGHLPLNPDLQRDPKEIIQLLGHNVIQQVDQLKLSSLQSQTLDRLIALHSKGKRSCVLIVQPCCTGKSVYYTYFTKQKNTMVIVAQPFTSLKQQTDYDAVRMHVLTGIQRGQSLKTQLAYQGMLVTTSYEKFHAYVSVSFCPPFTCPKV
jgi:hypothetical protein